MSAPIRIKRRAGGNPGAPTELLNAELAFNEVDDTLYYGKGAGGANGTSTTVEAIGGSGAFVTKTTAQTISGNKTFTGIVIVPEPTVSTHATTKAYVDAAIAALPQNLDWVNITNKPATIVNIDSLLDAKAPLASPALTGTPTAPTAVQGTNTTQIATTGFVTAGLNTKAPLASPSLTGEPTAPTAVAGTNTTQIATTAFVTSGLSGKANTTHVHAISDVTDLQSTLDLKAPLASPALTGSPTAPTPISGDSSTKVATTAFVTTAIQNIIGSAPGVLDTLAEIATALGDDPNFAATITTGLSEKLVKTANLSDVADIAIARTNLGLGTMATQNENAVAITGGTIDNVVIDGGTF